MKKLLKLLLLLIVIPISFQSQASNLKVFGPEFCTQYSAGECINFHYKNGSHDIRISTNSDEQYIFGTNIKKHKILTYDL